MLFNRDKHLMQSPALARPPGLGYTVLSHSRGQDASARFSEDLIKPLDDISLLKQRQFFNSRCINLYPAMIFLFKPVIKSQPSDTMIACVPILLIDCACA